MTAEPRVSSIQQRSGDAPAFQRGQSAASPDEKNPDDDNQEENRDASPDFQHGCKLNQLARFVQT